MSWKHEYLERAQRIAHMPRGVEANKAMRELEDDILGKLALWQASDLEEFAYQLPCQGSLVILQILQEYLDLDKMSMEG